jgi:hypothetical protein
VTRAEWIERLRAGWKAVEHLLDNPPDEDGAQLEPAAPPDPDALPTEPGELDADEPPWAPGGGS